MLTFKKFLKRKYPPYLDEVFTTEDGQNIQCLREGKWVSGRLEKNIRVDRSTHLGSGDQHAHVYGRKGRLVGVIRQDGSQSHAGAESVRLHKKDADALRAMNFLVPPNNVIEWVQWDVGGSILLAE